MVYSYTRIAGLVLAFGFFFGCSAMKSGSDVSSGPISGDLTENQLKERLIAVQKQIDDSPRNAKLYYKKGVLLTKWTQKKDDPSQRTSFYVEADKALFMADSLMNGAPADSTIQTDQLRSVAWSNEHNQGVQSLQNASKNEDFLHAANHFKNATAIMPDSVASYQLASEAFFQSGSSNKALQILEDARLNIEAPSSKLLQSLGYLYLETGRPEQAVPIFEKARKMDRRNFNIMHGLSNAYIRSGNHQKAITLLQQLTDRQPNNTTYRLALATQLYEAGQNKIDQLDTDLNDQKNFQTDLFREGNELLNRAEERYTALIDQGISNKEILTTVAQFYQNRAAQYQKLLPHLSGSRKQNIKSIIERSMSASIPLLRQLSEQNPDKQVWQNLYQAYTYLGMQEEAKKAKANI